MIRYLLSVFLSLALFCSQASAGFLLNSYALGKVPPTIENSVARASGSWGSVSSETLAATPPTGTSAILIIASYRAANAARSCTATWNGSAATEITDVQNSNRDGTCAYIVYNPSTGSSQDAVVTYSGSVSGTGLTILSLKGVAAGVSAHINYVNNASGQTCTNTTSSVASNHSLLIGSANWTNGSSTAGTDANISITGTGWTELLERGDTSSDGNHFSISTYSDTVAGASVSVTATTIETSSLNHCIIWELPPA